MKKIARSSNSKNIPRTHKFFFSYRPTLIGVGVIIGIIFTFGITYIRAQGSETIYGCVREYIGIVRIVKEGQRCLPLERLVTWNVQGPQGPLGPQGPQGLQGETGPQGLQGETGPQGGIGETGPSGIKGETGPQGSAGATGPSGAQSTSSGGVLICPGCQFDQRVGNRLAGKDFSNAILYGSSFSNVNLNETNLQDAVIDGSTFNGTTLQKGNLSKTSLQGAVFEWATLEETNLSNANLKNVTFRHTSLKRSLFANANLEGVIFEDTICPDLSNSDRNGNTCDGHW